MNEAFIRKVIQMRGDEGKKWLDGLPDQIAMYEKLWKIKIDSYSPYILSYNYAVPAVTLTGKPVVLKIGFPTDNEFITEREALTIFNGEGIAKLLAYDTNNAAMLLEKLEPGELLETREDTEATKIIASIMKKLHKPVPPHHSLPDIADWFERGFRKLHAKYDETSNPIPAPLLQKAEVLAKELLATQSEKKLLHGDLHHGNILSAQREPWLAIDPKGVIGESEYETAAMLRNPFAKLATHPDLKNLLEKRVNILSDELGFDRKRIIGWGIVQTVLSASWSLEDNESDVGHPIRVAQTLVELY